MKISHDYREFLTELQEEIDDGMLTLASRIRILRAANPDASVYSPIIDWSYTNTDDLLLPDLFDDADTKAWLRSERQEWMAEDKFAEEMTVEEVINELLQMDDISR